MGDWEIGILGDWEIGRLGDWGTMPHIFGTMLHIFDIFFYASYFLIALCIMDIMDILNIMIITAWMAMAGAVSALVLVGEENQA